MKKHRFEVLLFFIYLLLAIIFTWPLVLRFNSSIYGIPGDHFGQLWFYWWRKEALFSGKSLFYTPLIDAPLGYHIGWVNLEVLQMVLRFVVSLLVNEVFSLNFWLLLSFPLAGLAVFLLVKRLTGDRLAGAFSGLVYSFSMYHFSHAWEHASLIFIFWMPLYVLALVNFDARKNFRHALTAAALLAAVILDNFYYGYFTFFFTAFFLIFRVRHWWSWRSLKFLLLFAFLALAFTTPLAFPAAKAVLTGNAGGELAPAAFTRNFEDLNWLSARPWFYVLPSPHHPLLGQYSRRVLDWIAARPPYFLTTPYDGNEHNLYLGLIALTLSGVAVFRAYQSIKVSRSQGVNESMVSMSQWRQQRQWVWLFLFLGIVMMIFSAPPLATISLQKIYFPSYFLYKFFPMFRAYARFGVLVLLCVSVLAGFGLSYILLRIGSKRRKYLVTVLFSMVVLFEVLLPPMNVDISPPKAYRWLAERPGDFLVMEYPPRTDHSDLLYQRVHHKRLFDPRRVSGRKVLRSRIDRKLTDEALSENVIEFPDVLKEIGVRYVIFHWDEPKLPPVVRDFEWQGFAVAAQFPRQTIFEVVGR